MFTQHRAVTFAHQFTTILNFLIAMNRQTFYFFSITTSHQLLLNFERKKK